MNIVFPFFDEDYFIYAEDVDLGLRARLLGYKTMHVPDAVLYHMHQHTTKKSRKWRLTYMMERNLLRESQLLKSP